MKTITKASTKSPYKVYLNLDDNGCLLEVKRNVKYLIYDIKENGNASLVASSTNPYTPEKGQKDEIYYLDYLSVDILNKIQILTENYNYNEIILGLSKLKNEIMSDLFLVQNFSMDHSYLFSDYIDALNQLSEFTYDEEYSKKVMALDVFFDQYFYNFSKNWMAAEKDYVVKVLQNEITFLESLNSN